MLASETPALDIAGAHFVREVEPGEVLVISADGCESFRPWPPERVQPKLCLFEFVYLARPDSRLYGQEVHGARVRMGELLAEQAPVAVDMVVGVPDSGLPAAEGYSRRSGVPFGHGLVKNRYIGRTFINPDPRQRALGVRRKLNPLREAIDGKRLVVVDDSIVRGTTTRAMVGMLREAGAREVHLRISSPPYRWPCFYGLDTGARTELIAADLEVGEILRLPRCRQPGLPVPRGPEEGDRRARRRFLRRLPDRQLPGGSPGEPLKVGVGRPRRIALTSPRWDRAVCRSPRWRSQ